MCLFYVVKTLFQWSGPLEIDFYQTNVLDINYPIQFSNGLFAVSFCDSGSSWNNYNISDLVDGFTYLSSQSNTSKMNIHSSIYRLNKTNLEWTYTGYAMYICVGV